MKAAIFIITVFIYIPAMTQEKAADKIERIIKQHAFCKTRVIEDAELRYSPLISDNTNITLPKGTKVYVFFAADSYWFIKTDVYEGYVNERRLRVTNKMRWVKRDLYGNKEDTNHRISKCWKGMSQELAREKLGEPNAIYNHDDFWQKTQMELWVYDDKSLFFKNGILDWWKPSY